jgi:prepilin-type N-terminal cleavage/methylation domain-containing protein
LECDGSTPLSFFGVRRLDAAFFLWSAAARRRFLSLECGGSTPLSFFGVRRLDAAFFPLRWEESMAKSTRIFRPGFTLIELIVVIAIVALLLGLLMPAVQAVRESANRTVCANNLKQIGLACLLYANDHEQTLPPSYVRQKGASWMVTIMPYLEEEPLYKRWDLNKTYYDQSDIVRSASLKLYFCPSRRTANDNYQSVSGDVPSTTAPGDCGLISIPGDGPSVPGALADYAGNIGLSDL